MIPPVALGLSDVARLAVLVAGTQENDDGFPSPSEIDPVPRAVVNAELEDALSYWLAVAKISIAKTSNAGVDLFDCAIVPQGSQP